MILQDYNPANFYNNKGYNAITSNPNRVYNSNASRNYNGINFNKPRTSNYATRPVDKDELAKAQMALRSLKAKMNTAPKRKPNLIMNIGRGSAGGPRRFIPTFDIDQMNNNSNYPSKQLSFNSNAMTPSMNMKPQFISSFRNTNTNNIPRTSQMTNRKPQFSTMNYQNNQDMYNHINNEQNDNETRPLDKGAFCDKEKERVNAQEGEPTYPCPDCGRNFIQSVLEKHVKICKKVFQSKRKSYNMKDKRMVDAEQKNMVKNAEMKERFEAKNNKKKMKAEPKWKKQSEELRAIAKGNMDPNEYKPSVVNDDYTLCKFCNRRYNDEAYNKHLPGCERRFKEAQLKAKNKNQKKKR